MCRKPKGNAVTISPGIGLEKLILRYYFIARAKIRRLFRTNK